MTRRHFEDLMSDTSDTLNSSESGGIKPSRLDFESLPPVFILPVHIETAALHDAEQKLVEFGARLTYDPKEAKLFLAKISGPRRAELELRCRGIWTKPVSQLDASILSPDGQQSLSLSHSLKRKRFGGDNRPSLDQGSPPKDDLVSEEKIRSSCKVATSNSNVSSQNEMGAIERKGDRTLMVVKLDWLEHSITKRQLLDLKPYLVYAAEPAIRPPSLPGNQEVPLLETTKPAVQPRAVVPIVEQQEADLARFQMTRYQGQFQPRMRRRQLHDSPKTNVPPLIRQSTSENEKYSDGKLMSNMPSWVQQGLVYSCQRKTPMDNPNEEFIRLLKEIRIGRQLTGDEIGVRAYSTSIAALSAYTRPLEQTAEVLALPGCDVKIGHLFEEFKSTGKLQAVEDINNDESMNVLKIFYEIWGCGAKTARDFYFQKGWRDLDDIVEFGWDTLSRVQQIGVKYYDEFLEKIPRDEVEEIAQIIVSHAKKVRNDGIEYCIVGGYRRGKTGSGDVDIILSHRDQEQTMDLVIDVTESLEAAGWVQHTLLLSTASSQRSQQPLPLRSITARHAGFDTLDKSLVVWQHVNRLDTDPPPLHRRVDIIVASWPFVGCAVVGWSGGTTFQRDLRRYAKKVKNWKFDSSGVRDRNKGNIIALGQQAKSMEEAEKLVFEGMGLDWIEPWNRCTG